MAKGSVNTRLNTHTRGSDRPFEYILACLHLPNQPCPISWSPQHALLLLFSPQERLCARGMHAIATESQDLRQQVCV